MLWSCKTMLDWNHWHACLVVCVKKKDWVKEGWQGDNCMESEHSSWEPSLSLSQQRGRPSEVIYVSSGDGSWRAEGRPPQWNYWLEIYPPRATVSLFSLFLPLLLTFHLPPFWSSPESCHCLSGRRGKRRRKREIAHSQCHLFLPHSQTLFIPHACGLQSFAWLCFALEAPRKLSWVVLKAPPRFVSLYVGSIASYPSPPH